MPSSLVIWLSVTSLVLFILRRWRTILFLGNCEAVLCLVENVEDLLDQVSSHSLILLTQNLHVSQLGEVEVPLLLEPLHGELHLRDLAVEFLQLGSRCPSSVGSAASRTGRRWSSSGSRSCRSCCSCRRSLGHTGHCRPACSSSTWLVSAPDLLSSSHGQGVVFLTLVVGIKELMNHWTNSKLSWNLPLTSLSTGMILSTLTDLNEFCRTLKLLMYSCSSFVLNFTFLS